MTKSPTQRAGPTSNRPGFSIDPIPTNSQNLENHSSGGRARRKAANQSGYMTLLQDDDEMDEDSYKPRRRNKDSELDPNEESKHFQEETLGYTNRYGEQQVGTGDDFKLPFKIFRPCNTLWKTDDSSKARSPNLTKDTILFESSENLDAVNNSQSRPLSPCRLPIDTEPTHTNNLLKKIFKDIKIDAKVNEH